MCIRDRSSPVHLSDRGPLRSRARKCASLSARCNGMSGQRRGIHACTDNADTGIRQSNFNSVSKNSIHMWAGCGAAQ
eukprot:2003705-Lingulodinium_polyedra.AAC.1